MEEGRSPTARKMEDKYRINRIKEGWRKRKYKAVFMNKLSDAGQEASETQTWLQFALRCNYLDETTFTTLDRIYDEIFAMLNAMEKKVDSFCSS